MKYIAAFILVALCLFNGLVRGQGECSGNSCTGGLCCSQYGYCGSDDTYCGAGCQGGPCKSGGSSSGSSSGGGSGTGIVATWYCSLDGSKGSCFPGSCGTYSKIAGTDGIAATNPQLYTGQSLCHYQGTSCGQCWELTGPAGSRKIGITDCCAGYPGNPSCYKGSTSPTCDWCAANDHQHFDLDWDSLVAVCGSAGANAGHCNLYSATQVSC